MRHYDFRLLLSDHLFLVLVLLSTLVILRSIIPYTVVVSEGNIVFYSVYNMSLYRYAIWGLLDVCYTMLLPLLHSQMVRSLLLVSAVNYEVLLSSRTNAPCYTPDALLLVGYNAHPLGNCQLLLSW